MKTIKTIFVIACFFAFASTVTAQKKKNNVIVKPRGSAIKVATSTDRKCNPINISSTENILRDKIGRTLKVHLDRDYGFVEMMGQKQNIRFSSYKVNKPGNNWLYYLNDIKSEYTRVKYDNKAFIITITFEKERNEIKGKCPGCRVGNDKRAPDINWKDPKLRITLHPIAYNGSLSFKATRVDLLGKFNVNGPTDKFFPSIIAYFKNQIAKAVKQQMERTFNNRSIKDQLAKAFEGEVRRLNVGQVKSVDMTKDKIYLCNY